MIQETNQVIGKVESETSKKSVSKGVDSEMVKLNTEAILKHENYGTYVGKQMLGNEIEYKRKEASSFGDTTYMSVRERMELKAKQQKMENMQV